MSCSRPGRDSMTGAFITSSGRARPGKKYAAGRWRRLCLGPGPRREDQQRAADPDRRREAGTGREFLPRRDRGAGDLHERSVRGNDPGALCGWPCRSAPAGGGEADGGFCAGHPAHFPEALPRVPRVDQGQGRAFSRHARPGDGRRRRWPDHRSRPERHQSHHPAPRGARRGHGHAAEGRTVERGASRVDPRVDRSRRGVARQRG